MQQSNSDLLLEKATRQHTKGHNSRLTLRMIYEYGEISRADLARLTHLTRATVSEVVGELIGLGLVEEVGQGAIAVGRTPTLLSVIDNARQVAAISVTSDHVRGALVNLRGALHNTIVHDLPDRSGDAVLATIYMVVDALTAAANGPLLGIGINTPGLINTAAGTVVRAVTFGWVDMPLRALLQERSKLPVYIANDSHSLALAEYMFGPAQDTPNLVVVKVGVGIGAGIVLGGHLYVGEGYGAGEIGHLVVAHDGEVCRCGNRGCLETVASSAVLLRHAHALAVANPASSLHTFAADPALLTLEDVARAAEHGDEGARHLIATTGRALGMAVASLVSVLNVRRILITGRIAALGEQLRVVIYDELSRLALPALVQTTEVEVVAMGPDAPLLGAAAPLLTYELGLERLMQRPPLPRLVVEQVTQATRPKEM